MSVSRKETNDLVKKIQSKEIETPLDKLEADTKIVCEELLELEEVTNEFGEFVYWTEKDSTSDVYTEIIGPSMASPEGRELIEKALRKTGIVDSIGYTFCDNSPNVEVEIVLSWLDEDGEPHCGYEFGKPQATAQLALIEAAAQYCKNRRKK